MVGVTCGVECAGETRLVSCRKIIFIFSLRFLFIFWVYGGCDGWCSRDGSRVPPRPRVRSEDSARYRWHGNLVWCVALLYCVVNHCWLCCQLLACVVKPFIACVFDHSNALIAMPINPSSCWSAKQLFVVVDRSLMRTFETTVATIACVVDDGVRKPRQR